MKGGFYIRLAKEGILKNRKFYFPYILTCICMIMMFYIVAYLSASADFQNVRGGESLQALLGVGVFVIAVFSLIFLYYTNSFLIRRRQKEFGLYNILGMGKRNLVKILIWENLITAAVSLALGLVFGFLFAKLAELAAMKLLGGATGFGIHIALEPIMYTVGLFLAIFFLIMLRVLISIYRLRPVELLKSESVGEKPPKGNWVLALIGLALLAGAYYLAVAVMEPLSAMMMFFNAVVMVIVATYILFITGSVVLCRLLQKNRKYYYKTKHFVSISSMAYRMKRNGAGLASICILSTMVLVTVSSTVCLYAQTGEAVEKRYPHDYTISMGNSMEGPTIQRSETEPYIRAINEVLSDHGQTAQNVEDYLLYRNYAIKSGNQLTLNTYEAEANGTLDYSKLVDFYMICLEDYNQLSGENRQLNDNEVLLYTVKMDYTEDTLEMEGFDPWKVETLSEPPFQVGMAEANMNGSLFLVVKDLSVMEQAADHQLALVKEYGGFMAAISEEYSFDMDCDEEEQLEINDEIYARLWQLGEEGGADLPNYSTDSKAQGRTDLVSINGGLFFLGLLLGAVFLFGTVLIMYYKQITEGYEDQGRFDILMKVGMSQKEVKKSINSQVLTVFFLPLITAGIHLAFAFPLISKILMLLSSAAEEKTFLITTSCCYLVFALFYMIVYWMTSKSYYTIISTKNKK